MFLVLFLNTWGVSITVLHRMMDLDTLTYIDMFYTFPMLPSKAVQSTCCTLLTMNELSKGPVRILVWGCLPCCCFEWCGDLCGPRNDSDMIPYEPGNICLYFLHHVFEWDFLHQSMHAHSKLEDWCCLPVFVGIKKPSPLPTPSVQSQNLCPRQEFGDDQNAELKQSVSQTPRKHDVPKKLISQLSEWL